MPHTQKRPVKGEPAKFTKEDIEDLIDILDDMDGALMLLERDPKEYAKHMRPRFEKIQNKLSNLNPVLGEMDILSIVSEAFRILETEKQKKE